VHHRW